MGTEVDEPRLIGDAAVLVNVVQEVLFRDAGMQIGDSDGVGVALQPLRPFITATPE